MKLLVFGLLVALATGAPTPMEEPTKNAVEVIVNGHPEGEPLDIGDIVDVKLNEMVDGAVAAAHNVLHPFTAEGLAEIAAQEIAAEAAIEHPEVEQPAIELPAIELPVIELPVVEQQPEIEQPGVVLPGIEIPSLVEPEVEPIVESPATAVEEAAVENSPDSVDFVSNPELPESVIIVDANEPVPAVPEIVPVVVEQPEAVQESAPQIPTGEVYNDGLVQVTINAPEDAGVFATVQSWFSMALNYISNDVQTTQQII